MELKSGEINQNQKAAVTSEELSLMCHIISEVWPLGVKKRHVIPVSQADLAVG